MNNSEKYRHVKPTGPAGFPHYGDCESKKKLDDLRRLVEVDLFRTKFIDARAAASLLATGLKAYRRGFNSEIWQTDEHLQPLHALPVRINLVFAFLFDLVCNAEYLNGRMSTDKWIYCNPHRNESPQPTAYYSFLKQCPRCLVMNGIDKRIEGAQHKPSSHHIGELTTTISMMLMQLVAASSEQPLTVGVVSKQSHDVDAVAYRDNLLVLLEIKASPMVTFPVKAVLNRIRTTETDDGVREKEQHALTDVDFSLLPLTLYLPHRALEIPLNPYSEKGWPYTALQDWIEEPDRFLNLFSAWLEIFNAYRTPKTHRIDRQIILGCLANGWGDELDSNKTKPGLGRTDDVKKGTYQLMKYGAYYRVDCPELPIRGSLVANLDPLFLHEEYLAKLIDIRWSKEKFFHDSADQPGLKCVRDEDLLYLYDAIIAFNNPVINDPMLRQCFDFPRTEHSLHTGQLDGILDSWQEHTA
jgi:hypothetical protein